MMEIKYIIQFETSHTAGRCPFNSASALAPVREYVGAAASGGDFECNILEAVRGPW